MGDRELTDLANVLLTAAGAGLALACGYLVMKPATRTFRKWAGATLVALPGLLLGLLLAHPQLGVRSAYGGLTDRLLGLSTSVEETAGLSPPEAGDPTSSWIGGSSQTGSGVDLSPSGATYPISPDADDPAGTSSDEMPPSTDPTVPPPTTSPTETGTPPPSPTETGTPPPSPTETGTPPSPTETGTPPSPTETGTPPPSPTESRSPPPRRPRRGHRRRLPRRSPVLPNQLFPDGLVALLGAS